MPRRSSTAGLSASNSRSGSQSRRRVSLTVMLAVGKEKLKQNKKPTDRLASQGNLEYILQAAGEERAAGTQSSSSIYF